MMDYKPISELIWAKVQLKCASNHVEGVYAGRKVFDELLAASRIHALERAESSALEPSDLTRRAEKLVWTKYFGVLENFPGVKPGNQTYHSLAELIWAKNEIGFVGDPARLKSDKISFKFLRGSCLAEVKKNYPDQTLAWQVYKSEVKLWGTFGGGGDFPGMEPVQQLPIEQAPATSTINSHIDSKPSSIQSSSQATAGVEKPVVAPLMNMEPTKAMAKLSSAEEFQIQAQSASPILDLAVDAKPSNEQLTATRPIVKTTAAATRFPVAPQKPSHLPKIENRPFLPVITKDKYGIVAGKTLPPGTTSEERFARANAELNDPILIGPFAPAVASEFTTLAAQASNDGKKAAFDSASSSPVNRALRESSLKTAHHPIVASSGPLDSQNNMAKRSGGLARSRWSTEDDVCPPKNRIGQSN